MINFFKIKKILYFIKVGNGRATATMVDTARKSKSYKDYDKIINGKVVNQSSTSNYINKILRSLHLYEIIESSSSKPSLHSLKDKHKIAIKSLNSIDYADKYLDTIASIYATHCVKDLRTRLSSEDKNEAIRMLDFFMTLSNINISSFDNSLDILEKVSSSVPNYEIVNKIYDTYTPLKNQVLLFSLKDNSIKLRFRLMEIVVQNNEIFLLGKIKYQIELIAVNDIKSIDLIGDPYYSEDDNLSISNYIEEQNLETNLEAYVEIIAPIKLIIKLDQIKMNSDIFTLKVLSRPYGPDRFRIRVEAPHTFLLAFIKLNLDSIRVVEGNEKLLNDIENFYNNIVIQNSLDTN